MNPSLLLKLCKDLPRNGDGPRKGMYNHPIIQKAVNAMWFQNKRDEGILFSEMFKPIPVQAIAFVLTAVCHYLPNGAIINFLLLD
jgi:hypothetical protein